MFNLGVLVCKVVSKISKLFGHEGSFIGGSYAFKIDKDILKKVKYPKYIIGVTGSSGKGSTTELVARILKENNYKVVYNKNGSNVLNGIASLILNNTKKGVLDADILLMELDERYMKDVLKYFDLTHLILTNITRDQPPRNAHPEFIQEVLRKSIKSNTHLIINADDPLIKALALNHKGKVTTYGLDKNDYAIKTKLNNIDAAYCPLCGNKLKYKFYQYGHIGIYKCPNKDFERGNVDYLAHNININKGFIYINKEKVHLPSNFLYSVYFVTASFALCNVLGLTTEEITKVTNDENFIPKRLNVYNFYNRKWQMLASKNENNLSYKQSLDYIVNTKGKKTIILGFDNSSRRYSENDLSWIWDIDFEELNNKLVDKIVLVGRFKYDMLTRMIYAGISKSKIILIEDLNNELISVLRNKTKGSIYSCTCFDKEIELKSLLKKEGITND